MLSNTTALPRCRISAGEAADGLMMAPRGARLPFRTAMPPSSLNGAASGWITSGLKFSASATLSATLAPVTVNAALCSLPSSSRMMTGRPPA